LSADDLGCIRCDRDANCVSHQRRLMWFST
jgi:hypothetical protein